MLAAEPDNVRHFVAAAKDMLLSYHARPAPPTLSLIELPAQSKGDQWERSIILSSLFKLGPSAIRYLPSAWSRKMFERLVAQYLACDMFKNNLQLFIDSEQVIEMLVALRDLTSKSLKYQPDMSRDSAFKMNRLLWVLVFFTSSSSTGSTTTNKPYSTAIYPFAALYPLLDDMLDSPVYTKLAKTRLMDRIHQRLNALYDSSSTSTKPPPAVPDPEEAEIDKCVSDLVLELQSLDPFTRNEIILSLDTVRYAEELDFMDEQRDIDAYTRCAVKGAATLRTILLLSRSDMKPRSARWDDLVMTFGFIFQMIDDLQDCESDYQNSIVTPFSYYLQRHTNLDQEIIRLLAFIKSPHVEALQKETTGPLYGRFVFLNSFLVYLTMEAAVKNRSRLSVQLYKDLRHRIPVTKKWCKHHSLERETFQWLSNIAFS
jgi:hypothetical protein